MKIFERRRGEAAVLIDLENVATWPDELRQHYEDNLDLFRLYEAEDDRLDELRESDRMAYYRDGGNRYAREWSEAVEKVIPLTQPHDVESFHCSRLCDDEVAAIIANGMELPSPSSLLRRIDARVAAGDLPEAIAQELRSNNYADYDNRAGMLWFINGRSTLQDQGGLYRLFRHWGGEALYGPHEDSDVVAPYLHRTGSPCIIEASLPLNVYEPFFYHRALYSTFLQTKGMQSSHGTAAEGNFKMPIAADRILRVIRFEEPEFETLTQSSGWYHRIA